MPKQKQNQKMIVAVRVEPPCGVRAPGGKLGVLVAMMSGPGGATLKAMMAATGWQAHSVRGAIAGALKVKYVLNITSEKLADGRVYKRTPSDSV